MLLCFWVGDAGGGGGVLVVLLLLNYHANMLNILYTVYIDLVVTSDLDL